MSLGEKFVAAYSSGGRGTMEDRAGDGAVSLGFTGLPTDAATVWREAELRGKAINGGTIADAAAFLQARGWEILWVSRRTLTTRKEILLTPDMAAQVETAARAAGVSDGEYIRRAVANALSK